MARDSLFLSPHYPNPFAFTESVAEVFDDMLARSVPFYNEVIQQTSKWANEYFQQGTHIYDVGTSTGKTLFAIHASLTAKYGSYEGDLIGIDPSEPMIKKAHQNQKEHFPEATNLQFLVEDGSEYSYKKSSLCILNYVLQFVPLNQRAELLAKLYESLEPNGLLIISEKTKHNDPKIQKLTQQWYQEFKISNGYTEAENERKKRALKNFLIPLEKQEIANMLLETGFKHVEPILLLHNFITFIAIK